MNDALRQELSIAVRRFAQSSTDEVRLAVASARQLDRVGEVERLLRLIEVGCLVRDHKQVPAERALATLAPLVDEDWAYLDALLLTAPERQHLNFERYRKELRFRTEAPPMANPAALSMAPFHSAAATPIHLPGIDAAGPGPARADALALTSLILGIVSVMLGLSGCLVVLLAPVAVIAGVLGIVFANMTTHRGPLRLAGLVVSISGAIWATAVLGYIFFLARHFR